MTRTTLPFGLGALILGAVALLYGDFALPWRPALEGESLRIAANYASAVLLVGAGVVITFDRFSALAALVLASFYALCIPVLHAPRVLAQPANVSMWLGVSETLALVTGGFVAWVMSGLRSARRPMLVRAGQMMFALCLVQFGQSHFVYADFTAGMVPAWIAFPIFWAYATGCAHVAAGLSLLSGIATRLSTTLLAAMFTCFVVLLHVPRVVADPANRAEWVMLGMSTSLLGAAWIVRTCVARPLTSPERDGIRATESTC